MGRPTPEVRDGYKVEFTDDDMQEDEVDAMMDDEMQGYIGRDEMQMVDVGLRTLRDLVK